MRRMTRTALLAVLLVPAAVRPLWGDVITADFEDLGLGPNTFDNGSSGAGGFITRDVFFNNTFDATFNVWGGWAVSTMTDGTTPGFTNQYSAYPGSGAGGSAAYGIGFAFFPNEFDTAFFDAFVNLPEGATPVSVAVANTTYTALSMRDGDSFAKKFGGPTGNDPDFLRLTIFGFDTPFAAAGPNPGQLIGSVEFYLADYRFADNSLDYILDRWASIDLSPLAGARSLGFALTTTDTGMFGPNTPTYFALDNLRYRTQAVPEPASASLVGCAGVVLLAINIARRMRDKRASR